MSPKAKDKNIEISISETSDRILEESKIQINFLNDDDKHHDRAAAKAGVIHTGGFGDESGRSLG